MVVQIRKLLSSVQIDSINRKHLSKVHEEFKEIKNVCHKSMKKEVTAIVIICVHLVVDAKSVTKIVIFL